MAGELRRTQRWNYAWECKIVKQIKMALFNQSACKRIKIEEEDIVHRWHRQGEASARAQVTLP